MARRSADDPEDVAFLHDDEVFTADFHLGTRPFAEQNLVAGLDVERSDLAVVGAGAGADGDDFALLRLFLRRVGNDDPAGGLCLGLDPADEDSVMKWPETHGFNPLFHLLKVEHVRWHSAYESASDAPHMVVGRSSVNGRPSRFCSGVGQSGQPDPVTQYPADEHQYRDGCKPAGKPDPDTDPLPVRGEGEPGADPEAHAPIADERENQRPARVVEAAEHARADHLRPVDQLE